MLSAPPATEASISPSAIIWAAEMIACMALPHRRLKVSAGVSAVKPPWTAATRARYMSPRLGMNHVAEDAWPISSGAKVERASASRTHNAANSAGGMSLRAGAAIQPNIDFFYTLTR